MDLMVSSIHSLGKSKTGLPVRVKGPEGLESFAGTLDMHWASDEAGMP